MGNTRPKGAALRNQRELPNNRKGSILIWTVLLGFLLTSVFFFFNMRQRENIAVQRNTSEILNTKAYLESYADYLESLSPVNLKILRDNVDGASFDNITGSVTNIIDEILNVADYGVEINYSINGEIYVEWNKCPNPPNPNLTKGDLYVSNVLYDHDSNNVCDPGEDYDDIIGPISVTNPTIKTLNSPFEFRITAKDQVTTLEDNNWHIDLEVDLGYENKVTENRSF